MEVPKPREVSRGKAKIESGKLQSENCKVLFGNRGLSTDDNKRSPSDRICIFQLIIFNFHCLDWKPTQWKCLSPEKFHGGRLKLKVENCKVKIAKCCLEIEDLALTTTSAVRAIEFAFFNC